jgi:polar amino acid transport system ATP-binding protein
MTLISIQGIRKRFGDAEVLRDVSLDVRKGEAICIIGPSGSGKSTLLRCINALVPVDAGRITVGGIEVTDPKLDKIALRRRVGMVFQQYNLFPHRTALQNVMMAPIQVLKQDRREVEARARALLRKVRLEGKEQAYPGELSGGQQQRVAIARALSNNPIVILADEATGNLDSKSGQEILGLFDDLNAQGRTLIFVTHDERMVERCTRIIRLRDGFLDRDEPGARAKK